MERTRTRPSNSSHRRHIWRLFAVSLLVAALGIGMSAAPAHADTFRTATATGSSTNALSARAIAITRAHAALTAQASQFGETCNAPSVTDILVQSTPFYVYRATASALCVSAPSYTVQRSVTRQGGGPTVDAAISEAEGLARAQLLAAGVACINWSRSSAPVYAAPSGSWYIFNVTVNALCFN